MAKNRLAIAAAAVMGTVCAADWAKAATISLAPTADLYTQERNGTTQGRAYDANGANSEGGGIAINEATTRKRRGLLQFDLSAIPAGATITSATLTGEVKVADVGTGTLKGVLVSLGANSLSTIPETTTTYNSYAATYGAFETALGGLGAFDFTAAGGASTFVGSTVTSTATAGDITLLQAAYSQLTNQSILLRVLGNTYVGSTADVEFDDKETTGSPNALNPAFSANAPMLLNISYEVPEPASLGLIGLGALGMVRRRRTA